MTSPDHLALSAYSGTQPKSVGDWDMGDLIDLVELGDEVLFGPLRQLLSRVTGLPLSTWPTVASVRDAIEGLFDGIGVDFAGLLEALKGEYTGDDAALLAIQSVAKTFRSVLNPLGLLNLGQLTTDPVDLLGGAGGFDADDSVTAAEGWSHSTDGRTKPGAALFTASGVGGLLFPPAPAAVAAGKQYTAGVFVKWSGLTGSGAVITPQVRWYDADHTQLNVSPLPTVTSPPASSGSWIELGSSVTAPVGAVWAHVALVVTSAATAGSVWFDDARILSAQSSLPQSIISGLTGALDSLGDDVDEALGKLKDFITRLTGQPRALLADAIADVSTFAGQLKTILGGGTVGSPLPSLVGASIGQIQAMLNQLMDILRGLTVTPINSIVNDVKDWFTGLTGWKASTTSNVSAAQAKADAVQTGIVEGWAGGSPSGADPDVFNTMDAIRSLVDGGGYTRVNITSTTTWVKPAGVSEVVAVGIAAGQNGQDGQDSNRSSGGLGGGHKVQALDPDTFTSLGVVLGVNGAPTQFRADGTGGTILMESLAGSPGAIATQFGYTSSNSSAGAGGYGGHGSTSTSGNAAGEAGEPGTSSAAGTAGTYGSAGASHISGGAGSPGGSTTATAAVPCGGAGGGGGGGCGWYTGTGISGNPVGNGGKGGAGGFPGGGGGGGGRRGRLLSSPGYGTAGVGGAGGAGLAIIYYR